MELANVTWTFDKLADGSIHAFAWNTDSAVNVADAVAPTKIEAGKALYRQLAAKFSARGQTITSKNGDKLTSDGPLNLQGEISNTI